MYVYTYIYVNSILTVGSSDGTVVDYDFRKDDTSICFYNGHRRGVCSLKWSMLSGRYLASRGHDKLVHIWDACMPVSHRHPRRHQWLHRISSHTSIVKALDWCPTRSNLLASGGGRHDHCIKFWNTVNGSCLNSIDAGSEVCALLWDKNKSELVTSHESTHPVELPIHDERLSFSVIHPGFISWLGAHWEGGDTRDSGWWEQNTNS
ncbi:Anaphase-promoting complex subunit [Musa troglodytarum]|uniref:Anaphase-promoting complex subunit n=1 Tax=Musa troglodytarum TaxID=320322 RepID=A0A9E7L9T3_9LILI|nr:Anaphase-promoting complex subunit [Musa troglodytarum]